MHNLLPHDITIERSLALGSERYDTILECKESMVFTSAHIDAREGSGATLTENDLTDGDFLAMIDLNSKVFWI